MRPVQAFIVATVIPGLISCAVQPQRHYQWYNVNLTGDAAQSQLLIDQGQCTAVAEQIPIPQYRAPTYQPPPTSSVSTFSAMDQDGRMYTGQVQTTPTPQDTSPFGTGPLSGYLAGKAQARAEQQIANAKAAQLKVFAGCMAQRGWRLQEAGQQ
ncbi:MAG TPA: hypothetical protein VFK51_09665 [Burkholderiales bacterium]|jgi:hypothetical protein|nr:hypothetical protein [Burkholderiales bacterium]